MCKNNTLIYRRSDFNYEYLLIANCEFWPDLTTTQLLNYPIKICPTVCVCIICHVIIRNTQCHNINVNRGFGSINDPVWQN